MDTDHVIEDELTPGSLPIPESLLSDLEKAVDKLKDFEGYVEIICHDDADGLTAGAVLTRALSRGGFFFRTKVVNRLDDHIVAELIADNSDFYILADIGSGYLDLLEDLKGKTGAEIIVLDHHKIVRESENILQINCNNYGIDGGFETSGSVMAFLFACVLDMGNFSLVDIAFAGAAGDKQKIYGFKGMNLDLVNMAVDKGMLTADRGTELYGNGLAESLEHSFDPFFRGLTGRKENISTLLHDLGISGESSPGKLPKEKITALNSALMLGLIKNGVDPVIVRELIGTRYFSKRMEVYIEEVASIVNGCGSLEEHSLAISFCLAPKRFGKEAEEVARRFDGRVAGKLIDLEKGFERLENIDHFRAEKDEYGGTAAGVAIRYLTDGKRPLLCITKRDEKINISGRGTKELVGDGLDLAEALARAAEKVGGRGGGHPVASGATIPEAGLEEFLSSVDATVGKQLGGV